MTEPATIVDAHFSDARLLTLRNRISAAYKGISALLLREGACDLRTGTPVDVSLDFDERIDIHHIFPRAYCQEQGIDARVYDSVVNKTPLSAKTNQVIGGRAPNAYLAAAEREFGISARRLDELLGSHLINPPPLRANNFSAFFEERKAALLARIEAAMGKPAIVGDLTERADDYPPSSDEENGDAGELYA